MYCSWTICMWLTAIPSIRAAADVINTAWASGSSKPWRYPGAHSGDWQYWLEATNETLATMQEVYWNGTYWPSAIQWTGALTDTVLSSTQRTFVEVLSLQDNTAALLLAAEIEIYYSEILSYFDNEDAIQIFDAAYDDVQWVVLEWLEAIKLIRGNNNDNISNFYQDATAEFAHRAHIFYNVVQDKFNSSLCDGGLTWDPDLTPYKNAVTNELFIASSVGMYLYWPGDLNNDPYPSINYTTATNQRLPPLPDLLAHDQLLLENAVEAYEWFKTHNLTNAQGLVVDGYHISPDQTTCNERSEAVYTYNQGIILSGLRGLWEATGDVLYLYDGYDLISIVIKATGWNAPDAATASQWAGLGRGGIMEDHCDAHATCSQDAQAFKGAYFQHLSVFCEPLPTTSDESVAHQHRQRCAAYTLWVEHNAQAALSTRDSSGIIGGWWGANYANQAQRTVSQWSGPRQYRPAMRQDVNAAGRGRTIETQLAGLSVVKAALALNSWQERCQSCC